MNARVAFDTHAFVKRLEAAGMSAKQAEALAEAMSDIVLPAVATRTDLQELGRGLRTEIQQLGQDLRAEIQQLGHDVRAEMKDLELRLTNSLTVRLGAMIAAAAAFVVGLLEMLKTVS